MHNADWRHQSDADMVLFVKFSNFYRLIELATYVCTELQGYFYNFMCQIPSFPVVQQLHGRSEN